MYADQNPWRLLLLCVRAARVFTKPCEELCENGSGHVRGHQVSAAYIRVQLKQDSRVFEMLASLLLNHMSGLGYPMGPIYHFAIT